MTLQGDGDKDTGGDKPGTLLKIFIIFYSLVNKCSQNKGFASIMNIITDFKAFYSSSPGEALIVEGTE